MWRWCGAGRRWQKHVHAFFWRDDGLCSCPCTRKRQHALHQWKHRAFTDREWQYQRSAENQPCGTHGFNAKYLVEPGDIRPEKISIHGASPYQNAYLIDGISATNNLNPANESDASSATNISGMSQGYYLDVSLLDNVTLYDSFVPVEFGRFNGGVIDAKIKRFNADDSKVKLGYRTTRFGLVNIAYRWE